MANRTVKIDHLYRVEGHGGIRVELDGKKLLDVQMEIFEGSRFFEALIRGRHYKDVPMIMCRICAICSASHRTVAIRAVEKAIGLEVSRQTKLFRELLIMGEMIESHTLHLFCLAAPDFLGFPGVAAMADRHEGVVRMGLGLKKLGNAIQELVGGRKIHQVNAEVGGFSKIPEKEALLKLRNELESKIPDAHSSIAFIEGITQENLTKSPSVFSALDDESGNYCYHGDTILVSTGDKLPVHKYKELCNEFVVSHSHAKHSRYKDKPLMVGSLARVNFHRGKLTGKAQSEMERLEKSYDPHNILWNNLAQAVEVLQAMERGIETIDLIMKEGYKEEEPAVPGKISGGSGAAGTEAPRGTLFHSYTVDEKGIVTDADVITPTAINLENMEKDIRAATEMGISDPEEELKLKLEKVARAYDPCISCSVHLVDMREKQASSLPVSSS
ncbi:MAG: Ni/Fe hydrogenase subunit alpha [Deltaproteobacteria bacterium]|nr:Ni/Fe hydrogenase subunit alpha [Deltaproteobacteria bacterium]